jgi:hypothetical protein
MHSENLFQKPAATNAFSRANLELAFKLLRPCQPTLAILLQNALTLAHCPNTPHNPDEESILNFDEETVAAIVDQLAEIGHAMSANTRYSQQDLIAIRCLLMDWLIYAQSFMATTDPDIATKNL